jgi:hypothetical protein
MRWHFAFKVGKTTTNTVSFRRKHVLKAKQKNERKQKTGVFRKKCILCSKMRN